MPRIKEIEPRVSAPGAQPGRQATASDFGAAAWEGAARIGESLQSVGAVVKQHYDRTDVSDYSAKLAQYQAKEQIRLAESARTWNPGDEGFSEKFLEQYDEGINQLREGVKTEAGRQFFERTNGRMRADFVKSAWSTQAELAGMKASQDFVETKNSFSNSLLVNPTNFETNVLSLEDYAQTMVEGVNGEPGRLSREQAMKLVSQAKTEMAAASIRGWAQSNPEYAKHLLNSNKFDSYLNADQKAHLDGEIDQAIRGKEVEAERREKKNLELKKKEQINTQNQFLERMVPNSEKPLTVPDILKSNLEPTGGGSKEHFIDLLEKSNKQALNYTDASLFRERLRQIALPDGDPNKLNDEAVLIQDTINGKLSMTDMNSLRTEMQGRRSEEGKIESQLKDSFMNKVAKGQITTSNEMLGIPDVTGDQNYLKFQVWFLNEYAAQRKAGKTAKELLEPDSKDYLGKYIEQFKSSTAEAMDGYTSAFQEKYGPETPLPNTPKKNKPIKNPGETPEEYLNRTRGP